MPKIPSEILKCTFYLYKSVEDAKKGHPEAGGGTGFFIGVQSSVNPFANHVFAVTNWHVAVDRGYSVIRVNKKGGGTDIFDFDPSEWIFMPKSYDLAIIDAPIDIAVHDVSFISTKMFLSKEAVPILGVGPGEDIFMLGRFVDHDGGETNIPAARFGNISMMPEGKIKQENGAMLESYCLDVHSRGGYSGSPVFVYRTVGNDLSIVNTIVTGRQFVLFLGIHWGQFPELWEIKGIGKPNSDAAKTVKTKGKYIEGLSGMTLAAPAWALFELLSHERVQKIIAEGEEMAKKREAARTKEIMESISQGTSLAKAPSTLNEAANPEHKEDIARLPNEASKK